MYYRSSSSLSSKMQRGVLVCVLLLACHSRQGDSSASTTDESGGPTTETVPKPRPSPDPRPPTSERRNSTTFLDPTFHPTTIFTTLYSTTSPSTPQLPPLPISHRPRNTGSTEKPTRHTGKTDAQTTPHLYSPPTTTTLPPPPVKIKALSSSSTTNVPQSNSPSVRPFTTPFLSQGSTRPPTTIDSFLTFSTSNTLSLGSSSRSLIDPTVTSTPLHFDSSHSISSSSVEDSEFQRNRTLKTIARRIGKKLKFLNRVKSSKNSSLSDSSFVESSEIPKSDDSISAIKIGNLENLRVVTVKSIEGVHRNKVPKRPLHVNQVENLRLSLGDTSEIHDDVIEDRKVAQSTAGHENVFNKIRDVGEERRGIGQSQSSVDDVNGGKRRAAASQSTAKSSEVISPPPSGDLDASKHTSPITLDDINVKVKVDVEVKDDVENRSASVISGDESDSNSLPESTRGGVHDDYYEYSEYSDFPMKHFNVSGFREAAVIPDPDLRDDEVADDPVVPETEPEIVLPDDSLADTDLHDHDLIDSVMYIYFGGSPENGRGAGRQVLIVGAVIGLVAQFLTLASAVQRVRSFPGEETTVILLHTQLAFTVSNLVFMLGVQATSVAGQCAWVALSLHYLHMTAGVWLLINCAHVCLRISIKLRYHIAAWCLPFFYVLGCYILNRRIYETRNFCWMSIHRGLLLSFVAPAFIFLTLNTTLGAIGYTRARFQGHQPSPSPNIDRKSLRVAVILLPAFVFDWFVEVVALEKSSALVFPLLFVASKAFINWFIFACWLPSDDQSWQDMEDDYDEDFEDYEDDMAPSLLKLKYMVEESRYLSMSESEQLHQLHQALMTKSSLQDTEQYKLPSSYYPCADDLPLLQQQETGTSGSSETYKCGRREVCDFQMDPISTICS